MAGTAGNMAGIAAPGALMAPLRGLLRRPALPAVIITILGLVLLLRKGGGMP